MYSIWTHHIKDEADKEHYSQSLRHVKWVLEDLDRHLTLHEAGLDRQELSPKVYDFPNWDYRQADANGYRRCLRWVKQLINLDHKDTNERPLQGSGPGTPALN